MLKRILPFLFFLSFSFIANAQADKAAAFYRSGIEFKNKGMMAEALVAFTNAINLNKKYDSAYVELAIVNVRSEKLDSAIYNVKKAITISPKMALAHITLGTIYRDSKPNYDSALYCYFTALKIDSTNKVTFYSIAWSYNAKKVYDSAFIFAVKALDLDNNYRPGYAELGHAIYAGKKFTEGIEQFKKNLAISVVDLPIYYSGLAYTELKDKENALKQYEELKKINEKMATKLKKTIDGMK